MMDSPKCSTCGDDAVFSYGSDRHGCERCNHVEIGAGEHGEPTMQCPACLAEFHAGDPASIVEGDEARCPACLTVIVCTGVDDLVQRWDVGSPERQGVQAMMDEVRRVRWEVEKWRIRAHQARKERDEARMELAALKAHGDAKVVKCACCGLATSVADAVCSPECAARLGGD